MNQEENTGGGGIFGLFKWTKDALFGTDISPSMKYKDQPERRDRSRYAQDDTNFGINLGNGSSKRSANISRSNSWSGLDSTFQRKYELLSEHNENGVDSVDNNYYYKDRIRSLRSPAPVVPREPLHNEPTDTFGHKLHTKRRTANEFSGAQIPFMAPHEDDPLISKLFQKGEANDVEKSAYKLSVKDIPGKFPSPFKKRDEINDNRGHNEDACQKNIEYKRAYFELFAQMDLNNRDLDDLCEDVREQHEQFHRDEQTYKQAYQEMRAELVNELKKSKTLFENYYSLGKKYKSLKTTLDQAISHEAELATSRERLYQEEDLKNFEIQTLKQRISDLELKYTNLQIEKEMQQDNYESEIHDLLLQLSLRKNERKDTSAGSNIFSSVQYDRTPFHNDNNSSYDSNSHAWDTDYLKNIDGFIDH
ncbi:Bbp1p SKDI_16G0230 [Saccharomyces kudriavzevii IFO 1802]|uniref:Spindle pole component BBP1 n=2 Tax=Saccharomyces kudriavzevii (strain ATCC MYA-4449 / AS 2.2408 / CBS 8840 / NBRC 1802 / NCYC 2889) TaxID=226230 RepID=J6EJ09_SACK1|nr:uncharacterized protein SKDI_16G0230 [Saccharomyces kudriavzevii IFO 1802]EJT43869.1 BBP1-like protein [Saccharomyces kudriavzevii IFO 1802]CAI4052680.1 hypothetical protein SKDI_16G0230 [Saccharomyces kudriavzevii IFO 1802]